MDAQHPITSLQVAATYKAFPDQVRAKLLGLRHLIFELAATTPEIGQIKECLKWGEVSYLTISPKSGTTIRFGYRPAAQEYAIFVHCQTTLIETFRSKYPDDLTFDKNRAILFKENQDYPTDIMSGFLKAALTYHFQK